MYVIMYEFVAYLRVVGELWDDLLPGLQPPCLKVYIVAVEIRPTWNLGGEEERERENETSRLVYNHSHSQGLVIKTAVCKEGLVNVPS